jgi:hypothetical protein
VQRSSRRLWLLFAFGIGAIVIAAIVLVAVDHFSADPPNYTEIESGLWMGGNVAKPPPGVQAVLNLCEGEDFYRVTSHRWEPIRDAAPAPSLRWLESQVDFIDKERAAGHVVYVHCMNGVSRSGLVVTAYLMRRERWSRDQALEFVRNRRPGVRPNSAFIDLLHDLEKSLNAP